MTKDKHRTRLVLQISVDTSKPSVSDVPSWMAAGDIACAILSGASNADPTLLQELTAALQAHDVAVLIRDDLEIVSAVDADGVHLSFTDTPQESYAVARETLSDDAIVGVDAGAAHHTAMMLAEAGADFVAFAIPAQNEDLFWWVEVFEVPAIATGDIDAAMAQGIAARAVEFVAVPGDAARIAEVEAAVTSVVLEEA